MVRHHLGVLLVVMLASVSSVGCSKPESSANTTGSAAAVRPRGDDPPASTAAGKPAAGGKVITIPKYGLKGTAQGETEEPIIGSGDPVLVAFGGFSVSVSEAKKTDPKKIKDGQEAAKMFKPKNMQTETLTDGWALTYENVGSLGENYLVNTRREIDGKGYLCDTMQSTPEQQKKALAFCKSLTK